MNFRISQSADQVKKTNDLQDKKNKKDKAGKIYTINECVKCNVKSKRLFESGDFVYNQNVGKCEKCGSSQLTIMIVEDKIEKN